MQQDAPLPEPRTRVRTAREEAARGRPQACVFTPISPRSGPGFTPVFESAGLTIRPVLRGDLLPSKQVTRVRFPSPAPAPTRRHNACVARAAEGRPPAFQAGRRGSIGLLADKLGSELAELEFLAHPKHPGLLVRESWVRILPRSSRVSSRSSRS